MASSRVRSSTAPATDPTAAEPRTLSHRGSVVVALLAVLLCFLQAPGQIAPDTKLDLTADPVGFLRRAAHLWSPDAPMGQVQNQAYGYFFPHGTFFALGDLLGLPGWTVQRLWWALLLTVGFLGVVRLAEALRIGSPASRLLAAAAFVFAPRVLTTVGSISSETLPMMLAPWVLVPMVRALDGAGRAPHPLWQSALRSAVPVALMGAVNAVATLAATGVAAVWLAAGMFAADRAGLRRRLRFAGWWLAGLAAACLWWLVPLLMLSTVSPPFLDFIESSRVTTQWTSLTEVLRGTDAWTPFVSDERAAGAVLVTEPAAVVATGLLAAAGLAGLTMSRLPFRGRLITILIVGLLAICVGYTGALGSPIAEQVQVFLDGAGAPLRNVHKFDPLLRLPLALGLAHLLARVPVPLTAAGWRAVNASAAAQRRVAAALLLTAATLAAGTLAWTGGIAPPGSYRAIPDYWRQSADWIAADQHGRTAPARTLVVPGAPFADQLWGMTRDEPMQALAQTPWAVRDAIPLTPPGAIRALDAVQRELAAGRGSPGLAATLAGQGVGYLVLRADLDPDSSRSARPLLVAQALRESPGITVARTFGPPTSPSSPPGFVTDNGLRPPLPAITVYRVSGAEGGTGPRLTDLNTMPRVAGGPEAIAAINDARTRAGRPALGPSLLRADAQRAGLGDGSGVILTDTPVARETDFGRVDDHSSAIRAADDPRLTKNAAADYPVDGQPAVTAQWLLDDQPDRVRVRTSGSAADATAPGQTSPAAAAAAAFDGDPDTAWVSRGLQSAVGQRLTVEFAQPQRNLALNLTTARTVGPEVTSILVSTDAGSVVVRDVEAGDPVRVVLPSGATERVEIRAIAVTGGGPGNQFALADVGLEQLPAGGGAPAPLRIRQAVVLPEAGTGPVSGWVLGSGLPGRPQCMGDDDGRMRCAPGLGLTAETPGLFGRTLWVPQPETVTPSVVLRPKPGAALGELLAVFGRIAVTGPAAVSDPRGNAGAMVDGDPGTAWIAPEPTDRESARPELTVSLPQPSRVTGLRLTAPDGYPAAPTRVEVDLGTGVQKRTVGADGVVDLDPAVTDSLTLTVTGTADLLDRNDLGFTTRAPAGISELTVFGAGQAAAPDADRPVHIGCDTDADGPLGLGLSVSGRLVRLQLNTTAGALRSGEPVVATACPGAPVELAAGAQELVVNPGSAFSVDSVELSIAGGAEPQPVTGGAGPEVHAWSATERRVEVPAAAGDRVLSIPESTNSGWRARLGGTELEPVVVDGWQQGWVIPAGAAGTVVLDYPLDGPYRWSLLIGLVLVAALLVGARWPTRRRGPDPLPPARPGPRRLLIAAAGALAAGWLLTGWWGLLIALAGAGAVGVLHRRHRVVAAFGLMTAATLLLATGPWDSGHPYAGDDAAPQLLAYLSVVTVVAAAPVPGRWRKRRIAAPPDGPAGHDGTVPPSRSP